MTKRSRALLGSFLLAVLGACGGGGGGGGAGLRLDGTFGTGGMVTLGVPGFTFVSLRDLAFQSDGKLLVAGFGFDGMSSRSVVVRLDADGALDPSFGTGGRVVVPQAGGTDTFVAEALAELDDGRVVLAGSAETPAASGTFRPALMALTALGEPDPGFGTDGFMIVGLSLVGDVGFEEVLVQSDGRILAFGFGGTLAGDDDLIVGRFLEDGGIDPSYGVNVHDLGPGDGFDEQLLAGVLTPGDDLVAVGVTRNGSTGPGVAALAARFTGAALDDTFDDDGFASVNVPGADLDLFNDVLLQPDGSVVAAGRSISGLQVSLLVARFTPAGELDPAFVSEDGDPAGLNVLAAGEVQEEVSIVRDPTGGALLVGSSRLGLTLDLQVARLTPEGRLDPTFGRGGIATLDLGGEESLEHLELDSEGRLLAAGQRGEEMLLVRFR